MAEHMRTKLVNDALIMAIWKRKPANGLLWHTDRGSQYASDSHRFVLKQYGIEQSMSRKGNCWDNAVSESFFHTLKTECVNHETLRPAKPPKNPSSTTSKSSTTDNASILTMATCLL
jgi:transposase InsO family protein